MSFITVFFIITILMILYKLRYKKISNKIPLFFKNTLRGMKWESDLLKNCENLSTIAPHFKVDPTNIKLYDEPSQFYEYLMNGVKNARERIFMSALYVGTDPMSKDLISAVEKKCQTDQDVSVNILVDYLRGTRVEKGESTKTMLEGVLDNLQTYKKKPNFHFFLSPAFTGIWKKILPKRFNETLGVQHIKLYLFDDKMLISGANLSKDYFTNRQDRYVEISDKKLTDFYWDLLHTLSKNSFQLQDTKVLSPPAYHPSLEPEKFKNRFANDVKSFFENERWSDNFSETNKNELQKNTTLIFPTIQLGVCNVRQDEEVTNMVLSRLDEKSELVVTSGYFNLTDQYTNHLLSSRGKVSAIAASPLANGFFGSKGLSRHIPYAYTELELIFLKMVEKQNKQNNVSLNEYYRKDWTYHAKGVWSFREDSFMTLVGSPNFGYRSINRDLESQILIASDDPSLLKSFRHESSALQQFSSPVQHSSLNVPDRRSALWVRLMIHFIKRFM